MKRHLILIFLFFFLSFNISDAQLLPPDVRTTSTFFTNSSSNTQIMVTGNGTNTIVGYSFVQEKATPNDSVSLACGTTVATATVIYQILNEASFGYIPMNFVCPSGEHILVNRTGNAKTGVLVNYLAYDYTDDNVLSNYSELFYYSWFLLIFFGVFCFGIALGIKLFKHPNKQ